ncbi:SPFH domain-containing protein [Paenibacillus ginsengarvi]|uniref:SPFH domain-containing protein n=1 Tax=Paenibacillus ginsengarvi TaxID=400777 RepID=A0A3B0CJZ0_9BACL|nr:SPFH domain-containing protein [Paenibacillus ginsengarvi]RKN84599.1 SPFH domain-containing protein [Paenibacillus ginsengarvi]
MAIIDVLRFDGPSDVLVWKHPNQQLGTWTQLIVNESQEALFYKGGQALDLFGPGTHTLSTQNIPILSTLVNLPFGGKSPFAAEVVFVSKTTRMDAKWGTQTPIQLQEPKYQMFVSVRAFGQMAVQVEDTRRFVSKLVGTLSQFDQASLVQYFRGILMMNIKELISSYLILKKISILDIHAYLTDISQGIYDRVAASFAEYGLRLVHFNIDSINMPENDPSISRLKEALAKKAEMDILGYSYGQERTFNAIEQAAKSEGIPSAYAGAGLGFELGKAFGSAAGQTIPRVMPYTETVSDSRTCPQCSAPNGPGAKFCGKCGSELAQAQPVPPNTVPCNECGHLLPEGSKFCANCGNAYNPCPACKADNAPEALYCRECGTNLTRTCGRCQKPFQPGQKFCLECGNKVG